VAFGFVGSFEGRLVDPFVRLLLLPFPVAVVSILSMAPSNHPVSGLSVGGQSRGGGMKNDLVDLRLGRRVDVWDSVMIIDSLGSGPLWLPWGFAGGEKVDGANHTAATLDSSSTVLRTSYCTITLAMEPYAVQENSQPWFPASCDLSHLL